MGVRVGVYKFLLFPLVTSNAAASSLRPNHASFRTKVSRCEHPIAPVHLRFLTQRQNANISSPVEGHPISVSQPLTTRPAITSDPQDPSTQLSDSNEPIFKVPISRVPPGIVNEDVDDRNHTSPSIQRDPARVAHPNANLPAGAFDPRRGVGAGTVPAGVPPAGPTPDSQELQRQHGEGTTQVIVEKMPFKDQVKAWAKVHRGTVSLHYWILIELSIIIDYLSRYLGIGSKRSSVRKSWLERFHHNDNYKPVANKPSIYQGLN